RVQAERERAQAERGPSMTTRIISGVIIAVLAILVIAQGGWLYFGVFTVLAFAALLEFYRLTRAYKPLKLAGLVTLALMLVFAWWGTPFAVLGAAAAGVALSAVLGMIVGPKPGVTGRVGVTVLGALYVGLGFSFLLLMRNLVLPGHALPDLGRDMVLTVVFGTWAGDTMAYFTGKWFGATPMTPTLSPKKTWEGFAGGLIGTVLLVVLIGLYTELGPLESVILGLTIGIVGPLGDLFESLVKRDVQIKDSGRGIPGHGGILDRFDALLWTAVACYYLLTVGFGF
ncbi:MAG TPA: phosphatidate cytidylyltransferase, partial [Thermoleophilia bacterium]|nr:phosphatidate cytidylyltransferase [Thermoleophilia bacterium]